jgi:hypothetical protein
VSDPIAGGRTATTASGGSSEPRWDSLLRILWPLVFGSAIAFSMFKIGGFFGQEGNLFLDAHIYYRATAAWLDGGNPWTTSYEGVPFAGLPPTLLLNLPLVPLGESVATAFWVVANTASVVLIIRRLHLPLWTVLLFPVVEGWLGATPDIALAGLLLVGGGWFSALTKPYSGPMLLADRQWKQVGICVVAGIGTIPILPWRQFYESRELVLETFARFATHPVSASGSPLLIIAVVVALASLGWRRGWVLFTPGLLAQQGHYLVFSLEAVKWSRILAVAMTIPIQHTMAVAIIAYALVERFRLAPASGDRLALGHAEREPQDAPPP